MPTRRFVLAACLGLVPAKSVVAQVVEGGPVPPGDIAPWPAPGTVPRSPRPPLYDDEDDGITERQAVRIARRRGIVEVDRVRRRSNVWIISGRDEYGDDIRVVVNDDGDVVDVRRD